MHGERQNKRGDQNGNDTDGQHREQFPDVASHHFLSEPGCSCCRRTTVPLTDCFVISAIRHEPISAIALDNSGVTIFNL
jgi:hypothetical protein